MLLVRFVPLVIDHDPGYRIWPSLAQHSITQVMIYNLGYDHYNQGYETNYYSTRESKKVQFKVAVPEGLQ